MWVETYNFQLLEQHLGIHHIAHMSNTQNTTLPIPATAILSGLGALQRPEICSFLAWLEEIGSVFLAKGAVEDLGKFLKIVDDDAADPLDAAIRRLMDSSDSDALLRHRLWIRLSDALAVPSMVPLSSKSARKAAAALAVRASERLTPSLVAQRKKNLTVPDEEASSEADVAKKVANKAQDLWSAGRDMLTGTDPLPFPYLVREEILNLFANPDIVKSAEKHADPEMAEALRKGHNAARKAIAGGGGWIAFAAVVGQAGFAPYILAAKLSAWIPMVSGPVLVSLLATLISPATVVIGIGAMGWLAMGKGSQVVRSQVAARMCVLLAMSDSRETGDGLAAFLADMRKLDKVPSSAFGHLSRQERTELRSRLSLMNSQFLSALPTPAGQPPASWDRKRDMSDVTDAGLTAVLTAGEMLWHAMAIDPNVIAAADFSRAADLGDPLSFALEAQNFALRGAGYSLRGYTAERLALDQLVADGHDVALTELSNTPGLDLIVDGNPVQVKFGTELSNLTEHFKKYPNIPVIANKALAEKAAERGEDWADLVTTLPGFEIEDIESQIADALGHAIDLADPDILEIALSIGALRGGIGVLKGQIPVSDLPAWLLLDGSSRGMLGLAGGKAGAWLGLVVIGPAGALVLGPAVACAALLGNGFVKGKAQEFLMADWLKQLISLGADLQTAQSEAVQRRIRQLSDRPDKVRSVLKDQSGISDWMASRAQDDLVAAIEDLAELGSAPTTEAQCVELLFKVADLSPCDGAALRAASKLRQHFAIKPGVYDTVLGKPLDAVGDFLDKHLPSGAGAKIRKGFAKGDESHEI
ncbi:MAG: hypothetical protein COC12_01620 [Rhodobacteraceae bacterium]|nr:MAG: hypothetical protein COC12_01620 [Paracoccaceae bacterium]